jgi:hypothetical protein
MLVVIVKLSYVIHPLQLQVLLGESTLGVLQNIINANCELIIFTRLCT